MARRQAGDTDPKDTLIDRRSYLKLATAAGAFALTGLTGSAAAQSEEADTSQVVDLGEEGLSEGDVIDPYLDEHFQDGNEVRIPAGEYQWNGGALGGPSADAALIGQGEVIFEMADDAFYNNVRASSGTIELRNITVRGAVTGETRIRLETAEGAKILVDNVNFPDGCVDDTGRGQAYYLPSEHAGLVEIRNCYVANFSDNGMYACSMGREAGGRVIIDSCVARNNNISGFRIGGRGSELRNSLVLNDAPAPVPSGISHNQRGIRIDYSEHSKDLLVKNCDVIHSGSTSELGNGGPMRWSPRAGDSTGHIENVRILNNVDIEAIAPRRDAAEGWTGDNIHVSGDGDLDVPSWFENVYTGSDAEAPTASLEDLPEDGSSGGDSGNGNGGDGTAATELRLVTAEETDLIEYEFTTSGEATPLFDRETAAADEGDMGESATQNDDGTWTASGALSGTLGGGDAFEYEGEVRSFDVSGDASALELYRDGTQVAIDELVVEAPDDGDGSDGEDGSGGDGSDEPLAGPFELQFAVAEATDLLQYEFTATGEVVPLYDHDTAAADEGDMGESAAQNDDGTWTGVGALSGTPGGGDAFEYRGDVVDLQVDGDASALAIHRDGTEVAVDDLVVEAPDDGDGSDGSGGDDGDDGSGGDGSDGDSGDDGSGGDGSDGDGGDGSDGDDGDGSDGGSDLENVLIVDGTASDDASSYQFEVTGEVVRDDGISTTPEDATEADGLEDSVGTTTVEGTVGKGVDGYRYSGSLVDFQYSGSASLTIERASQ